MSGLKACVTRIWNKIRQINHFNCLPLSTPTGIPWSNANLSPSWNPGRIVMNCNSIVRKKRYLIFVWIFDVVVTFLFVHVLNRCTGHVKLTLCYYEPWDSFCTGQFPPDLLLSYKIIFYDHVVFVLSIIQLQMEPVQCLNLFTEVVV